MRLIRLTTTDTSAFFDNSFNEDILVKPNSKICLQAMTTQLNKDVLTITSQNNEVQFTLDGVSPGNVDYYTIYLTTGTYDSSNMESFFEDFTFKLNMAMTGNSTYTLGKQWQVALKGDRVEILCTRGDVLTFNNNSIYDKYMRQTEAISFNTLPNQNWVSRSGGTVNTGDAYFFSVQPANQGASSLRCQIREDPDADSGFILGYTRNGPPSGNDAVEITDITYGIIYRDGQHYDVIVDGEIIPADQLENLVMPNIVGPADALNDTLVIDTQEGYQNYYIIQNGVPIYIYPQQPPNTTLSAPEELFAVGVCVGNTQVFNFQNTTDPYYTPDKVINYTKSPLTPPYGTPIATKQTPSNTYFRIVSTELAMFLGFTSDESLYQVNSPTIYYTLADNLSYLAYTAFFLKINIDSYIVELLDIKINSMDATTTGHKNFLAVIPNEGTVVERVAYTSPVLIWIDMNNKETINLRQIKARIVKEDLTPITCYGLSQLVLLIDQ